VHVNNNLGLHCRSFSGYSPDMEKPVCFLWLDDVRPAPGGWLHVKTVAEAQKAFADYDVQLASLDHDLGACDECSGGLTPEEWLETHFFESMPNCTHFGTGYDLCLWMAEHGIWPPVKPTVHSANPVGRDRMRGVIERYFPVDEAV
jgi:hypothetical protein